MAAHLRHAADPDWEDERAQARFARRGLWLAATWQGRTAVQGTLDPEAGEQDQAPRETHGSDGRRHPG